MTELYVYGAFITIMLYSIIFFIMGFNFDKFLEIKSFWWMFIYGITSASILINRDSININISEIIIGSIIADTIFSLYAELNKKKYWDGLFILLHHVLWGSLLFYHAHLAKKHKSQETKLYLKYFLIGQIFIAILDIYSAILLSFDIKSSHKINMLGHFLNLAGRLVVGNYIIYLISQKANRRAPYYITLLFNTMIGLFLATRDDITSTIYLTKELEY